MVKYKKQKAVVTYTSGRKEEFKPKTRTEEREMKERFSKMDTIKFVAWSDA